jgi:hypothetical protein
MKITTKDLMYKTIAKLFETHLDGENKDGLFITIDGQQYNIKITAKKAPIEFGEKTDYIKTEAPAILNIDWDELLQKAIIDMFGEAVDYVQSS